MRCAGRSSGLTIIEAMLAMTILACAFLSVTYAVVVGQQHLHEGDERLRAVRLGQDLLEEIISRPYCDPQTQSGSGPEAGEASRSDFDDADDYDGYAEPAGGLADGHGGRYTPAEQAYSRSVTVASASQFISQWNRTIPGLTVTVTVRNPRGELWQVIRFIPQPAKS